MTDTRTDDVPSTLDAPSPRPGSAVRVRKPDRFSLGMADLIAEAERLLAVAATVPAETREHSRANGVDISVLEARVSAQLAAAKDAAQALTTAKAALADANGDGAQLAAEVLTWSRELATRVRRSTVNTPEADVARWMLADGFRTFRMPRLAGARRWLGELLGEERRAQLGVVGVVDSGAAVWVARVEGVWGRMAEAKRDRVAASEAQRRAWGALRSVYRELSPAVVPGGSDGQVA